MGQETGDFGRVKPGVVNDDLLPALDYIGKVLGNRPHSTFALTAAEDEMQDRVWRFLVAPPAEGFVFQYGTEITRAQSDGRATPGTERYYRWLQKAGFASVVGRYNAVANHAGADLALLPAVFAAICAVKETDRQRQVAADGLTLDADTLKQQRGRAAENAAYVLRFQQALRFRYASYSYALDHLLVEVPDRSAQGVDAALSGLAGWVERADGEEFCGAGGAGGRSGDVPIASRALLDGNGEGEFRK